MVEKLHRLSNTPGRVCLALAALLQIVAGTGLAEQREPAPRPRVHVSIFNLGDACGQARTSDVLKYLADWADATPVKASCWHDVPPGCPPGGWISIVVSGFKQSIDQELRKADVFAFLFDANDGAVNAVAHLHYGMTFNWNAQCWYWDVPLPRLCDDLRQAWQDNREKDSRKRPRLQIIERKKHKTGTEASLLTSDGSDLLNINASKGMPQISAMAMAAATKAGWRPLPVTEKPQLSLGVILGRLAASIRLTDHAQTGRQWITHNVPITELTAQLMHDFFMVASDGLIFAVARAGAESVLSGQDSGRLCVTRNKEATLLNGVTGAEIWSRGKDALPAHAYTSRPTRNGASPLICQYAPQLAILDIGTGKPKVLAPIGASQAWSFDVDANRAAVAHESSLSLYRNGKEAWTKDEESPITCGPRLAGQLVLAGTRNGHVIARSLADGKERWRRHTAPGLRWYIATTRGKAAVWSDESEMVYAYNIDSGKLMWQFHVGDVLAAPVQTVGNLFLVAGKDNRICLLRSMDGKIVAETTWPNWLIDCRSLDIKGKPVIICLDIAKNVTILDPGTLAVTRSLRMPEVLRPGVLYLPQAPASWCAGSSADMALAEMLGEEEYLDNAAIETQPGIVVVDQQGFVHMITPGKGAE